MEIVDTEIKSVDLSISWAKYSGEFSGIKYSGESSLYWRIKQLKIWYD